MSEQRHWLYRPENPPRLWRWGAVVLALTVAAQVYWHVHGHFGFDGWFGFSAIYGFATCVAMVLFAKVLGMAVKRQDRYYEDRYYEDRYDEDRYDEDRDGAEDQHAGGNHRGEHGE